MRVVDTLTSGIKAKRPYKRVKLFSAGQLGRLILGTLRKGARPMTTAEVDVDAEARGHLGRAGRGFLKQCARTVQRRFDPNLAHHLILAASRVCAGAAPKGGLGSACPST